MERSWFHRLMAWKGIYDYSVRGSNDIKNIVRMYMLTHYNIQYRETLVKSIMKDPVSKKIIDNRFPLVTEKSFYKEFADHTLGGRYYAFLERNNISPVIFRKRNFTRADEYTYIILRIMSTHDVYHVLLGQEPNLIGEGVVAAFTVAQLPAYLPPAVHLSAGLMRSVLTKHNNLDDDLSAIVLGSYLGHQIEQLFNLNWDNLWGVDIDEVRKQLNIDVQSAQKILSSQRKYEHSV